MRLRTLIAVISLILFISVAIWITRITPVEKDLIVSIDENNRMTVN